MAACRADRPAVAGLRLRSYATQLRRLPTLVVCPFGAQHGPKPSHHAWAQSGPQTRMKHTQVAIYRSDTTNSFFEHFVSNTSPSKRPGGLLMTPGGDWGCWRRDFSWPNEAYDQPLVGPWRRLPQPRGPRIINNIPVRAALGGARALDTRGRRHSRGHI
jgi:hypothetical protein